MEEQYKSSFVRALAERWQFWRPMAVEKVGKLDRVPRMILRSALDTFDVFNRMPEFLDKLDGDDKVRLVIEAEIKALAAAIDIYPDISVYGQPEGKAEGEAIAPEETEEGGSKKLSEILEEEQLTVATEKEHILKCQFCSYKSQILHNMNRHYLAVHRDKIETDASEDGQIWTYIRIKPREEGIEEPEPQYVQVLDPDTDRWQIVDRDTGEVTNRKKSPGPYKNVPTMDLAPGYRFIAANGEREVKDAGDGEAGEQALATDQAEDQQ